MAEERVGKLRFVAQNDTKPGLDEIKKDARAMAQDVKRAGKEAAEGIASIGDGAPVAGQKVEAVARSIIGSIQRTTASLEAGERGTAKYYESIAKLRGVPPDVLKPYLDQLREAEKLTQRVQVATVKNGVSAAQTAAALRGVPAQFTDIMVSLQGGQNALTVFLQQGGQLKDMFGGPAQAAKALGSYVLGLVNPLTLAAVAVAALGIAYYKGSQEGSEYNKAIVVSGNVAGVTSGQLGSMAREIANITGTTGAAAEALALMTTGSGVASANLQQFTLAAVQWEKATGQAVSATVKQYAELGKSPVEASVKLNEQYGYLTASVYAQIKALDEQGRSTEAAELAQRTFADTISQRSAAIVQNLGYIERAWNGIKGAVVGAGDAIASIGREFTLGEQIRAAEIQLQNMRDRNASVGIKDGLATQQAAAALAALKATEAGNLANAKAVAERAKETQRLVEWERAGDAVESNAEKRRKAIEQATTKGQELINAGLLTEQQLRERIATITEKFKDKATATGAAGTGQNEVADLKARTQAAEQYLATLRAQGLEADKLTEGEKRVLQIKAELKTSITGVARAQKELALTEAERLAVVDKSVQGEEKRIAGLKASTQAHQRSIEATDREGDAILGRAQALEAANAVYGKGTTAIEQMRLAQLQQQLAEAESTDRFDPAYIASLRAKTEAQERYAAALQKSDLKNINAGLDEWARNAQEQSKLYQDEAALARLSALERAKIVAARQSELNLARQLDKIDKSSLSDDEKEVARSRAREIAQTESSAAVAKVVQDDMAKAAEQVQQSLTDALMTGGKSGAEYVEGLFRAMVLRPVVNAIVSPVAGAVTSALGLGSSGTGGLGSVTDLLSSVYSLFGTSSSTGTLGSLLSSSSMGSLDFGGMSLGSLGSGAGAGAMGSLMSAMPIIGAFYAAFKVLTSEKLQGEERYGGRYAIAGENGVVDPSTGNLITAEGHYTGSDSTAEGFKRLLSDLKGDTLNDGVMAAYAANTPTVAGQAYYVNGTNRRPTGEQNEVMGSVLEATQATINSLLTGLGSSAQLSGLWGGFETSGKGRGGVLAGGTLSNGASFGESGYGDNYAGTLYEKFSSQSPDYQTAVANYVTDLKQATLQALLAATDIPKSIAAEIPATSEAIEALTGEQADAILSSIGQKVAVIGAFRDAMNQLPFEQLKNLSFDAAAGLIGFAGSLDVLGTNLNNYYDKYYSDAEKAQTATANLTASLSGLGLALPDLSQGADAAKAAYRAMVEQAGTQLGTAEGQKTYAELLSLAPAFDALATSVTNIARDAATAAAEIAKANAAQRDSLYSALTTATSKEKSVVQARADVARESVQTLGSIFNTLRDSAQSLYGDVSSTAAMQAQQGGDFIAKALQTALATGYMPDGDQLSQAVEAARGGLKESNYDSAFEYDRARLVLAGQLSQLQAAAGVQLSDAEKQLKAAQDQVTALDSMLDYAKLQLDAANGINTSVKTVAEALEAFTASLSDSSAREMRAQVPAFASGGLHAGGMRLVGGYGPELEVTGPSRIFNAGETRDLLGGGAASEQVISELRALREESRAQARALVQMQLRTAKILEQWDVTGLPEEREV